MERATQIAVNRFGVNFFLEDEIEVLVRRDDILSRKISSTFWLREVARLKEEAKAQNVEFIEPESMLMRGRIIGFEPDVPAHDDEERFIVVKQELESKENEFFLIECFFFLEAIDDPNGRVTLLTKPLFEYGLSYTNRHTKRESRFVSVSPGRETESGQFLYLVETIKGDKSIEYDLLKESCALKMYNSTEYIQSFL